MQSLKTVSADTALQMTAELHHNGGFPPTTYRHWETGRVCDECHKSLGLTQSYFFEESPSRSIGGVSWLCKRCRSSNPPSQTVHWHSPDEETRPGSVVGTLLKKRTYSTTRYNDPDYFEWGHSLEERRAHQAVRHKEIIDTLANEKDRSCIIMLMARGLCLESAIAVYSCHRKTPVIITDLGGNQYEVYNWGTRLQDINTLLCEQHEEFRETEQGFEIVDLRLNDNDEIITGVLLWSPEE